MPVTRELYFKLPIDPSCVFRRIIQSCWISSTCLLRATKIAIAGMIAPSLFANVREELSAAREHRRAEMRLLSSVIKEGEPIPPRFTCEGENISPEFYWEEAPKETKSFVLILHDPDAPRANGFTHWLLYDIPPNVTRIREDLPKQATVADSGLQGKNDSGKLGYTGPCPPSGKHRYFARLFALRKQLDLPPGATANEVKSALEGKVIEQTELMGTFAKSKGMSA